MSNTNNSRFRIVKRMQMPAKKAFLYYAAAVLAAMCIGAILLMCLKINPFLFYKEVLTLGMLDNVFAYKQVEGFIKLFVPLLITSLALSLAFKMRFWNVGGEGQFIVGVICASVVGLKLGDVLPTFAVLILMAIAGGIGAGIIGALCAWLKVKFGTNETLMTLMFNYMALYLIKFFGEYKAEWNFFLDPGSERPRFLSFSKNAWMPTISIGKFSLNISLVIAVIVTVLIYFYVKKTKQGYEITVVGDSPNTAKYSGMKVGKIVIRTVFLSAFMIGAAGAMHVSTAHVMSTSITNDVGWTGVIVAWLSKLNPAVIFVVSILITVLQYGCQVANAEFAAIDSNFANLLQGIILFSVLVADFLIRFKVVRSKAKAENGKESE